MPSWTLRQRYELMLRRTFPSHEPDFDPSLSFNTLSSPDGTALATAVRDELNPIDEYLQSVLQDASAIGTSYVHAGGMVSPGGKRHGVSFGLIFLDVHNAGSAGIAAGRLINQRSLPHAADQDVVVEGTGSIHAVKSAGMDSSG